MSDDVQATEATPCPVCVQRQQEQLAQQREHARRVQSHHAAQLFQTRRRICDQLDQAISLQNQAGTFAPDEAEFLPSLLRTIGRKCEEAITAAANDARAEFPDLADGIVLMLDFVRRGGRAKHEWGDSADGEQLWQVTLRLTPDSMDGELWQRLHDCRDVFRELVDTRPVSSPEDDIPF